MNPLSVNIRGDMNTSISGQDHLQDQNPVALKWAAEQIPLPEYCSSAHGVEKIAAMNPDVVFADVKNKSLPVCDAGNTLKSAIYAFGFPESDEKSFLVRKLAQVADVYGITEDFNKYQALFAGLNKSASAISPDEDLASKHAFSFQEDDNVVSHFYPIDSPEAVAKSAFEMPRHLNEGRFPADWAVDMSRNIVKAARAFGMLDNELPEFVVKNAEERELDLDLAARLIESRRPFAGENFEAYTELMKAATLAEDHIAELIEIVEALDEQFNVKYAAHVPLPTRVFYSGMRAADMEKFAMSRVMVSGVIIPQQAVASVKEAAVRMFWPEKDADRIMKVVKSASESDTSLVANSYITEWTEAQQNDFLAYLVRE